MQRKARTTCNGNNGSRSLLIVSELRWYLDFKQLEIQKIIDGISLSVEDNKVERFYWVALPR
jgi:hypothetical protein